MSRIRRNIDVIIILVLHEMCTVQISDTHPSVSKILIVINAQLKIKYRSIYTRLPAYEANDIDQCYIVIQKQILVVYQLW